MDILTPIIQEIQSQTGLTLTPQKDTSGIHHYTAQIPNTPNIILFGICNQINDIWIDNITINVAPEIVNTLQTYYNGTYFLIIKTHKDKKLDISFLTQPHKFIDLNDPHSIDMIIETTQEHINQNPNPRNTKETKPPPPKHRNNHQNHQSIHKINP